MRGGGTVDRIQSQLIGRKMETTYQFHRVFLLPTRYS